MTRVDLTLKVTVDLADFECNTSDEFLELIEDSESITLEIVDVTGETLSAEMDILAVEED